MKLPVYLDHHATTPLDPRALEVMLPFFRDEFANPASSTHLSGKSAADSVENARSQVAHLIGAEASEIIFTSGATESNNLALQGVFRKFEKGAHLITQVTEHKSVLETARFLEKTGVRVTYLPVTSTGKIRMEDLERAISPDTVLISVMAANNEIGTLQPMAQIGRLCKSKNILFHADAAQAAGKIPIAVNELGVDLMSLSSHKMYGPKGIGCLFVRKHAPRVSLVPLFFGGGQEGGLRPGTSNVPAIVGFAKACEIALTEGIRNAERVRVLRDRLEKGILSRLDGVLVNGDTQDRLPGNLNLSFPYLEGRQILKNLEKDLAVSSGSACTSGAGATSYVLKALGWGPERTETSVRFGVGLTNSEEEIDFAVERVVQTIQALRNDSVLYQAAIKQSH